MLLTLVIFVGETAAPAPERVNRAGRPLPSSDHGAGATSGHVVLPWWLIAAVSTVGTASLLGLAVACYCLYKSELDSLSFLFCCSGCC